MGTNPVIRYVPAPEAVREAVAPTPTVTAERPTHPPVITQPTPTSARYAPSRPSPTANRTLLPSTFRGISFEELWLHETTVRERNCRRVNTAATLGAFETEVESNFCSAHPHEVPPSVFGYWQSLCCNPAEGAGGGFLTPQEPGIARYLQESKKLLPAVLGYWKIDRLGPDAHRDGLS